VNKSLDLMKNKTLIKLMQFQQDKKPVNPISLSGLIKQVLRLQEMLNSIQRKDQRGNYKKIYSWI